MKISEELKWRGFVNQTTYDDPKQLDNKKVTFYWGVDPSAPSMQIGNLAAAMMVKSFIKHGHKAVLLIGGATGLIGDPDGKAEERKLKSQTEIEANKRKITDQYKKIFEGLDFKIVDNYQWFKDIGYLEFLRDIGKHVPTRQMLARDFVQSRLSKNGSGISYAEFSYSLIQGYDFLHLNREHGVTLQVAASDQWGNSITGVDLIRRIEGREAHVWTTPLVVNKSTGKKFGKTEEGAVWLDPNLTNVFQFFQFWLNVDDEGVEDYLKIYTELDDKELNKEMASFNKDKASRSAQKKLAYEVTKIVHGQDKADSAKSASKVLFGGSNFLDINEEDRQLLAAYLPSTQYKASLQHSLVDAGLATSNTDANRLIDSGAISINGRKVNSVGETNLEPGLNLVRRGKNKFAIVDK